MNTTIFGLLLITFGMFLCVHRRWLADKLQRFYSTYPLVRLAGPEQLRSRGSFIVVFGLLFVGIGVAVILERWVL